MPSSASSSATASGRALGWRDWVGLAARLVLGGVLFVAGALKVTNLPSSALAVRAYKMLQYDVIVGKTIGEKRPVKAVEAAPAKIIVLEDAFLGDDELKTNLAQYARSCGIELWTA